MQIVRPPAVAGAFYPADPGQLRDDVDALLDRATRGGSRESPATPAARAGAVAREGKDAAGHGAPKALVVPHAGYAYSGPVAASAYASLAQAAHGAITRVVIVGPCHRVPVEGIAVPEADALDTPLGRVPVDAEAMKLLATFPEITRSERAHAREHSLEVQLPFLQRVLGPFAVVPLAVGGASAATVARVLDALWGGPETLIVVSSDLSHYLPYAIGKGVDRYTAQRVLELAPVLDPSEACGATPLNALLIVARERHLTPALLDLRSSGDTAGPRDGVVGYGAFGFFEDQGGETIMNALPDDTDDALGKILLTLARGFIAHSLGGPEVIVPDEPRLRRPGATFVTLTHWSGELHGCIGTLEPRRPLVEDVRSNALAAAFLDGRSPPLHARQLRDVCIEISLLGALTPLPAKSEADAIGTVRPHVDGLVLSWGPVRGVLLPQVWEKIPDPARFLRALKSKAGLPPDFWSTDIELRRFGLVKWREERSARAQAAAHARAHPHTHS